MPAARAIGVWLARMRAATYALLEEIRFRTGVLALAAMASVIGAAAAAAVVAADGGPPAAHRTLAGQARPALPPVQARPVRPEPPPRKPGKLAPPARRVGAADRIGSASYLASSAPRHIASSAPRLNFTGRHGQRQFSRRDHFAGRDWWRHHFAWHRWWRHGWDPRHDWHPYHDRGPHHHTLLKQGRTRR